MNLKGSIFDGKTEFRIECGVKSRITPQSNLIYICCLDRKDGVYHMRFGNRFSGGKTPRAISLQEWITDVNRAFLTPCLHDHGKKKLQWFAWGFRKIWNISLTAFQSSIWATQLKKRKRNWTVQHKYTEKKTSCSDSQVACFGEQLSENEVGTFTTSCQNFPRKRCILKD